MGTRNNVEETEKCLKQNVNGVPSGTTTAKTPDTTRTSHGSALEMTASYFDISFQPTAEVTHRTVWPQVLACLSAASFHFPVGIVVSFSAILIPQLEAEDSDIKVTTEDTSWIASLVVLVVPLGALMTGYLVDSIGRLNTIKLAAVPYILGWILIANATNLPMILIGRFLTGFTLAMGPSPAVVYITEVARPDLRGALICTGPSMTSLGMVIIYAKGAFLHWRTVAWMAVGYCVLPIVFMTLWSPESPVWLISKGRTQDALRSLTYLARTEKQAGVPERQLAELQKEHNEKTQNVRKRHPIVVLAKAIIRPTGFKPLFLLLSLFFFQQFSGIYVTIFYAVTFFKDVGTSMDIYVATVLIGTIRMLVGLPTTYLLRKFGRRPLYMISGLGMAITMFITGYYTKEIAAGNIKDSWVPVATILIYMTCGVTGLMSIPWTMTAELYPLEIRGMAQGITISLAHVIMFLAIKSYRSLVVGLGGAYGVHWLYAAVSLSSVFFVFVFLPETHKKLLSEIQDYFVDNTIYLLSDKQKKTTITTVPESNSNNKNKNPV